MKRLILSSMCIAIMFLCVNVERAFGIFPTEMLSMDLSGSYDGIPVEYRKSQSLQSLGEAEGITNGVFVIDSFFDVFFEISYDGSPFEPQTNMGTMETKLSPFPNDPKATFETEMVSMSLSGDVGGISIEIRESPSLPSPGDVTLTDLGDGRFQVDSFFDVFYEISVEGGPFQPQATPGSIVTTFNTPEPTSMALMLIGLLPLALSRRKRWR